MLKEKFTIKGYIQGFKTILSRNGILIILIHILNQYGNNMKNGFRNFVAVNEAGGTSAILGIATSVFLFAALIARVPAGSFVDKLRKHIKHILAASLVIKALCFLGFLIIKDNGTLYLIFAIDGFIFGLVGTTLPALLAITVDRRAMGSAYALMLGLTGIVCSPARSQGISLYKESGLGIAVLITIAITVVAAVMVMCMDNKKLLLNTNQISVDKKSRFSKSRFAGFNLKLIPLCLIAAMPIVLLNGQTTFFAVYAESLGMNYLGAQTAGAAINGVSTWIVGILCDIVNPSILVIIGLAGQALAPFMWAFPATNAILSGGLFIFSVTRYYSQAIRILGLKLIASREKGAFMAAVLAFNDIFSILGTTIMGFIAVLSYQTMWIVVGVWCTIALAGWLVLEMKYIPGLREQKRLEDAASRETAAALEAKE